MEQTKCVEKKSRRKCYNCKGEDLCGLNVAMHKTYKYMANGERSICFADITQGMFNIKAQLELSLTTIELFGDTFFVHKIEDTRKCAIYKWAGDRLYLVKR